MDATSHLGPDNMKDDGLGSNSTDIGSKHGLDSINEERCVFGIHKKLTLLYVLLILFVLQLCINGEQSINNKSNILHPNGYDLSLSRGIKSGNVIDTASSVCQANTNPVRF